jgi:hypothetical protein
MARRTRRINITMDPRLHDRLRRFATDEGTTVSALIDRFCRVGLPEAKDLAEARRDPLVERVIEHALSPEMLARAALIVGQELDQPQLFAERLRKLSAATVPKRKVAR